jgi:hypothetical protein
MRLGKVCITHKFFYIILQQIGIYKFTYQEKGMSIMRMLLEKIAQKNTIVVAVHLGYVGLPLAIDGGLEGRKSRFLLEQTYND